MKILFLSFTCEDIGVAMVTNMISQLQESFPLRRVVFYVEISSLSIKWTEFANEWQILSAREHKIRIPKRPCNILYITAGPMIISFIHLSTALQYLNHFIYIHIRQIKIHQFTFVDTCLVFYTSVVWFRYKSSLNMSIFKTRHSTVGHLEIKGRKFRRKIQFFFLVLLKETVRVEW